MSNTLDNLIAFRVLYMLVTPFEKTDAYKLGIVDKEGNALKKTRDFKTTEEKNAYNNLTKLVFSLKRLISKVPGGKSQIASIIAAYWLIKESQRSKVKITESYFFNLVENIENGVTFIEEEIEIENFIELMEEGGIANVTGVATSTDKEAIRLKKAKAISGIIGGKNYIARRAKPVEGEQK